MAQGLHRGELILKPDDLFGLYFIFEDLQGNFEELKNAYYREWDENKKLRDAVNQ